MGAIGMGLRAAPLRLTLYLLLAVVAGGIPVVLAWLTKALLDQLAGGAGQTTLTWLAAGLAATGLATAAVPHASRYLMAEFGRAVGLLAQDRLYGRVNQFGGIARFEEPHFLNQIRMAQHSGAGAPVRVTDSLVSLLRTVITAGGFLGSLLVISRLVTVVVVLSSLPVLIAEIYLARERAATMFGLSGYERREIFYGTLLTSTQAAKEVRLFGIGDLLRNRMRADRRAADAKRRRLDLRSLRTQSGLGLLSAVVSGAGLVWAVGAAGRGALTIGDVSVFVASVAGIQSALAGTATTVALAHQDLLQFRHYLDVLGAPPDLPEPDRRRELPPLRHGIELRDVWFRYSPQHPWTLRGVNLFIPCGKAFALVGGNGAGKSTVVKLLCRLYDPCRGTILWDGVDIRQVPVERLRARLSAVFQDYMHYDLSAAENVGIGDVSRLDDSAAIEQAARRAGIHDKLSGLPRGYATMLSRVFLSRADADDEPAGVVLSGGEWQRVALARSLVRESPELLILDEPSSGLDAEAEYEIHQRLRQHRLGRTSLLISHRLGTLRDADTIAVLHDGAVVERGSHDDLLAAGGRYAQLFLMQANGYQVPAALAEPAGLRVSLRSAG